MRFYGKAESAATRILEVFESGDLPKALAHIFIRRKDEVPCRKWSWSNQLLAALHGHCDARGYRQWQAVGRHVKKGEHGFPILVPLTKKIESQDQDTGEATEKFLLYGFKHAIVFGLSQTDGEPLPNGDPAIDNWIASLPLIDVAGSWGLSVETFNGEGARYRGLYRHGQGIALGVKNLSTWAHEITHAADDRSIDGLKGGQHLDQEIVAELGGAVLLTILGKDHDADLGGCWQYVKGYADRFKVEPITACQRLLKRICDAVALILDTAEQLASVATVC